MDIRADAHIPFPRDVVFVAYRDEMTNLLPYLPNVRSIEIKSRTDKGSVVEFVNEWRGGGDIPAAIRAVLSESVLAWTDYATWHGDDLRCDWRTATHAFTDAVSCSGSNRFLTEGDSKTLLEIRGTLVIDAKKIRGVPTLFAGKIGRAVEEFLVGKIQSNLVETAKGLEKYLEDRQRAKP
jgi:hypothetical protein